VTELFDEGDHDLVQSSVTCALAENVEDLTLTGKGAINGTGNALDNIIVGNDGRNLLYGGDGADTLTGNGGADTFKYKNTSEGGAGETIADFHTGKGGDILDIHDLLIGLGTNARHAVDDGYLQFVQNGSDTEVQVDRDGSAGNGFGLVTLVTLTDSVLHAGDTANLKL
jgi:Ca2+-binding RTX toxin-like protein